MKAKSAFVAVTMSILASSALTAADTTWQGGDGSWNDETMWNNGVPNDNAKSINLSAGGSINFDNSYTVLNTETVNISAEDRKLKFTASDPSYGLTFYNAGDLCLARDGNDTYLTFDSGTYSIAGTLYAGWWHQGDRTCTGRVDVVSATLNVMSQAEMGSDAGVAWTGEIRLGQDLGYGEMTVHTNGTVNSRIITVANENTKSLFTIDGGTVINRDYTFIGRGRAKSDNKFTGAVSDGKFVLNSGTFKTYGLEIGSSGGYGELYINGGAMDVTNRFNIGTIVDATEHETWAGGTGKVYQVAGEVKAFDYVAIGNGFDNTEKGSYGEYNISGGTFTVGGANPALVVGRVGEGKLNVSETLNETPTTVTVGSALQIGEQRYAKGSVSVSGGTLTASDVYVGSGLDTVGQLEVSGGEVYSYNDIRVGASGQGALTVSDNGYIKVKGSNGTDSKHIVINANVNNDFAGTSTINLNGGVVEVETIRVGDSTTAKGVLNFNGGTLKSYANYWNGGVLPKNDLFTVNVKAGGAIFDIPEDQTVEVRSYLNADGSLGGIVKRGKGTLKICDMDVDGVRHFNVTGYIKVEEGALEFWGTTVSAMDKIVVAENATLTMHWGVAEDCSPVRVLENNGTISTERAFPVMENPPTLTKAVWTGARSDDVNDPANWALYYNDGTQDVRVSADELPTVDTTIYWDASIDDALPDLSALTYAKKVLVLPAETVTLTATSATTFEKTYNLSGWHLDASAATLNVVNARMLGTAAVATAITSAGIDGRFANVTSDDGKGGVKVSYGNDGAVGVSRRGGFVIVIQ